MSIPHLHTTPPPLPARVVFDTRAALLECEEYLAQMNEMQIDLDGLLNDLVNHLRYAFHYPEELASYVRTTLSYMVDPSYEDIERFKKIVSVLGGVLYHQLCAHQLYDQNNTHHYHYEGVMRGKAMVLTLVPYHRSDY